ncbi:MAG TPA: response regulator, partial [bacterium]|nr:response regulator [bacterium]
MKAGRPAVILKQVLETKPLTLFIVDDEHGIRQLLVRILSHAGYHVVENRSAREALNNLKNVTPALIVSDVVMPDMDGFELCNQIRKNPDTEWIPFLFLTAKSEETDRLKGFETGADAYLLKPFSNRELLIRISNLLMRIRQFYRILETPPADLIDIPEGPGMLTGDRPDEIMSLKTLETMDQGFIGEMRVRLLIDLLQFISTYPDTFMVSLINEHKEKAALILDNGAVIHALCGDRTGENALEHIMLWEKGIYRVIRLSRRPPRTMEKHIEQLAFKHYIVRGNLPDQPAKIENEPGDSRFVSDEV